MAGNSKEVARAHLADAGVEELPVDWDVVTLGDLFTEDRGFAVGVMYPGNHDPDGVPLIKAGDLNGSIINPQPDFRISKDKHHEYRRTALEGGELLMTLVGNVGQCAVVPPRMAGWNTARACAVMRLADSSENHFVQQCLLSRPLQHHMDVWCNTTVQATLNLKEVRQLPLPWPPKQSRDAIAAFGKALDDMIELNRRMNAMLEAMARALFQSWFVDFDPVRAKLDGREPVGLDPETAALFPDHLEDTELGHTPKGWEVRSLDKIANYLNGLALQKYPAGDGLTLPVIKIAQLRKADSIGADRCNTDLPSNYIVQDGDVLFSWSGSLEVELWCGGVGALNQHLFKVTSSEFPKWFYYFWTIYHLDQFRLIAADKATTMGHIQRGHLSAAKVLIPPRPLLDAMTRTMTPLIDHLISNRIQSRSLATLRDTLLPKLLSGELSVADRQASGVFA